MGKQRAAAHANTGPAGGPPQDGSLSRFVPGRRVKPYNTDPAEFVAHPDAARTKESQDVLNDVPPSRATTLQLDQVIGSTDVNQITQAGQIVFHAVGDTGRGPHTAQTEVADQMARDYERPHPAALPAFFLHLGDVMYGPHKDLAVGREFYEPYDVYPGKIIALAGNHDGERTSVDPKSLAVFLAAFCATAATHAPQAGSAPRLTMTQPGVYFTLEAPFVRIVCLYSNTGEFFGHIGGSFKGGAEQAAFLNSEMKRIAKANDGKALIVAAHHPTYSGAGHAGSPDVLKSIDDACSAAKILPHAVLSGHSHNYQRFTRTYEGGGDGLDGAQVPFLVVGNGGVGIQPVKPHIDGRPVRTPLRGTPDDHVLAQYFNGYGYLRLTVSPRLLIAELIGARTATNDPVDSVTVDLKSRRVIQQAAAIEHPLEGEEAGRNRHSPTGTVHPFP